MTIKKKLYSIVFGEMIMFLLIAGIVILSLLPILKLQSQSEELSELAEQVLVTRLDLLNMFSSPMSMQYEKLQISKKRLSESFETVAGLDELKSINKSVGDAIDRILQLEAIFNIRWDELVEQIQIVLKDADRVMFSKAVPLIRFYKSNYSNRVSDYEQVLYTVSNFEKIIISNEETLSSAHKVIITQDEFIARELSSKLFEMLLRTLIIFIVMMVAIVIAATKMAAGMVNSLNSFAKGVAILRNGRLDTDFNITTKDEIGTLGENLNEFASELSSSIRKIKHSSGNNLKMKAELSEAAENAHSSAKGILDSAVSIRGGMVDLDGRVTESGAAVTTVNSRTGVLQTMLEEQTSMIEESTSAVTEMIASISNVSDITLKKKTATDLLVKTAGKGGERLDETISIIRQITANVDDIRETASIIQSVAAQTSLLAMNAAIEAAHAGEYGAGFSVVAEEIRKLAEASSASSKRIGGVLKEVIVSIEQAAESGDETKRAFTDINREVTDVAGALDEVNSSMDELSAGGKQILGAMNSLQGYTSEVQEGGEAMTEAAKSLEEAFRMVERVTSGVMSQISDITDRIEKISGAVEIVSAISNRLSSESEMLEAEVARFTAGKDLEDALG